jgi:virginiamycin B lyase
LRGWLPDLIGETMTILKPRYVLMLVFLALAASAAPAGAATGFTITDIPLPAGQGYPAGVAVDPSGAVWFTEWAAGAVGRYSGGHFTKFSIPNPAQSLLGSLVNGPDGARWFVDDTIPKIWRIGATGALTGFRIPPCTGCAYSGGSGTGNIVADDGALWYSRPGNATIGRITTTGQVHEFPVPSSLGGGPGPSITAGPDGAIWFAVGDGIARMTTAGAISLPYKGPGYADMITTGPDGNLWFTEGASDTVGRLTPSGHATLFRVATGCSPDSIAPGDGFLWVACDDLNLLYRISTTGAITSIRLAKAQTLAGIAQAPNGAMWFTDLPHGLLVRITGS